MSLLTEFKKFALRGNMIDLAIGIIIGASFNRVISSMVGDVLLPPIGLLIGGTDFSQLSLTLKDATPFQPAVEIKYGAFINTLIDFTIVAIATFAVIKTMNKLSSRLPPSLKEEERKCPECLMPIPEEAKRCCHCGSVLSETIAKV